MTCNFDIMSKKIALLGGAFDPPHQGHQTMIEQLFALFGFDEVWLIPCYSHPFDKSMTSPADRLAMTKILAKVLNSSLSSIRDRMKIKESYSSGVTEWAPPTVERRIYRARLERNSRAVNVLPGGVRDGLPRGGHDVKVLDLEIKRRGKSYTIDSLRALADSPGAVVNSAESVDITRQQTPRGCCDLPASASRQAMQAGVTPPGCLRRNQMPSRWTKRPNFNLSLIIGSDNALIFTKWKDYKEIFKLAPVFVFPRKGYPMPKKPNLPFKVLSHPKLIATDISSTEVKRRVKEGKSIDDLVPEKIKNYIQTHNLYLPV